MSELSTGDDSYSSSGHHENDENDDDTHSSGENWRTLGSLACGYEPTLGAEGLGFPTDKKEIDLENDVEKDDIIIEEKTTSQFLQMPSMVREKMYLYLSQKELLNLRKVCLQILMEVDNFADFTVVFRKPLTRSFVPIPFPHLKFLTVDNPSEDLPWFWVTAVPKNSSNNNHNNDNNHNDIDNTGSMQSICSSQPRRSLQLLNNNNGDDYDYIFHGTIDAVKLMSINQQTLHRLAHCRSIKGAIITTDVFQRKLPKLYWHHLTYLRLHFYIVRFVGSHELEMLENFDSLCSQTFPNLTSLKICLRRSYLNPQSSFSIRALRFMAKHWRSLKDMTIEMEAEKCDLYPQTTTPEFTLEELENLQKIQLNSLKIDATEILCHKCRIWQDFIKQQRSINVLKISIYAAQNHPVFFYPINRNPMARTMKTLSIGLWGLHGHYPVDLRRLTSGIDTISNVRLFRSPTILTEVQDGPEILNIMNIPQGLVSLTIKGFIMSARDIETLLRLTPQLNHLTMKNVGSVEDMGVHIEHLPLLQEHPSLATACIDVNNPSRCADESFDMFLRQLESGRLEHKIIGSRDNLHTFLFIDRERTTDLMRMKGNKPHDDDVLPGLDYPTGFINRFDNWKIRS